MKRLRGLSLFKNKKRRNILAVSLLGVFAVVGGVIAYNTDISIFRGLFHLNKDIVSHTEDIPFPLENWVPCEEKEKYVTVTNVEGQDKYVRIKFRDAWKTADNQTDLSSVKDGVTLATINFANNWENYWELRDDGYYYYKTVVAAGASTQPLLKSVTLNCDADFGAENVCTETATGVSCTKPSDPYDGAKYHLYIDIDTSTEPMGETPHEIDCNSTNLYDAVACQTAENPTSIDFRRIAVASANPTTANGNGVNQTTENGSTVYYYRGEVNNNFVIWANKCWRILRTTASGGTKLVYSGEPDNGACPEHVQPMMTERYSYGEMWGDDITNEDEKSSFSRYTWTILGNSYDCAAAGGNPAFQGYSEQDCYDSYADSGYMFGPRDEIYFNDLNGSVPTSTLVFANDVTYSGGQYTLDSATAISGQYSDANFRASVVAGHHYTCHTDGTTCSTVFYHVDEGVYISMTGGEDIDGYRARMNSNQTDSAIKRAVDYWYTQNIASYDNDVDDSIYCNDRSLAGGTYASKNQGLYTAPDSNGYTAVYNSWVRNAVDVDNNYHPSLDCAQNDAFTVSNAAGNQALTYKIGLLSIDEVTYAGLTYGESYNNPTNFLSLEVYDAVATMSPAANYGSPAATMDLQAYVYENPMTISAFQNPLGVPGHSVIPVVSLKQSKTYAQGGDGTRTNPYVVQ